MINPLRQGRRSIRLQGYDYSSTGAYFVTICVQDRLQLFGNIADDKMMLSLPGEMIEKAWIHLPDDNLGISIDEFIVMPNHVHGIILIESACPTIGWAGTRPAPTMSLPDVMRRFKSSTAVKYIRGVEENGWSRFRKRLWQRNYYERIIRSEIGLNHVREYIRANPANWTADPENPAL